VQEKEGKRIDDLTLYGNRRKEKENLIANPNDFWIGYTYLDRKFKVR
jgi:hypothetical protein